jgi:hypothetical protein
MRIKRVPVVAIVVTGVAAALAALGAVYGKRLSAAIGHGEDGLEELTKQELYDRAQAAGIPGRSEMNKHELIRALRTAA